MFQRELEAQPAEERAELQRARLRALLRRRPGHNSCLVLRRSAG